MTMSLCFSASADGKGKPAYHVYSEKELEPICAAVNAAAAAEEEAKKAAGGP